MIDEIIEKINQQGDNKILFIVYENKIELTLNYQREANEEQILKLYSFLKFYLKQFENELNFIFEDIYYNDDEQQNG